jgi:hypothetical protein
VDEHYVAGGAFDQGRDRGLVVGAGDEIAFPVAGYGAVLDLGRPLGNHDHGVDEPGLALLPGDVGFTAGPAGAQCCLDLAFESASGLDVQGLVNRFWAHTHLRVVSELLDQRAADLLW